MSTRRCPPRAYNCLLYLIAAAVASFFNIATAISITRNPISQTIVEGNDVLFYGEIENTEPWQGILWHGSYQHNRTGFWYIDALQSTLVFADEGTSGGVVASQHGTSFVSYEMLGDGTRQFVQFAYSINEASRYDQGDYGLGYYDRRELGVDRGLHNNDISRMSTWATLSVLTRPTCSFTSFSLVKTDDHRIITLTCDIVNDETNPTLTWYREGVPISQSTRLRNSARYDITIEDNGAEFTCIASAPAGLDDPLDRSCVVQPLKTVFVEPHTQKISVGEDATFTCSTEGLDVSSISWEIKGKFELTYNIIKLAPTLSSIQVSNAKLEQSRTELICKVILVDGDVIHGTSELLVQEPGPQTSLYVTLPVVGVLIVVALLVVYFVYSKVILKSSLPIQSKDKRLTAMDNYSFESNEVMFPNEKRARKQSRQCIVNERVASNTDAEHDSVKQGSTKKPSQNQRHSDARNVSLKSQSDKPSLDKTSESRGEDTRLIDDSKDKKDKTVEPSSTEKTHEKLANRNSNGKKILQMTRSGAHLNRRYKDNTDGQPTLINQSDEIGDIESTSDSDKSTETDSTKPSEERSSNEEISVSSKESRSTSTQEKPLRNKRSTSCKESSTNDVTKPEPDESADSVKDRNRRSSEKQIRYLRRASRNKDTSQNVLITPVPSAKKHQLVRGDSEQSQRNDPSQCKQASEIKSVFPDLQTPEDDSDDINDVQTQSRKQLKSTSSSKKETVGRTDPAKPSKGKISPDHQQKKAEGTSLKPEQKELVNKVPKLNTASAANIDSIVQRKSEVKPLKKSDKTNDSNANDKAVNMVKAHDRKSINDKTPKAEISSAAKLQSDTKKTDSSESQSKEVAVSRKRSRKPSTKDSQSKSFQENKTPKAEISSAAKLQSDTKRPDSSESQSKEVAVSRKRSRKPSTEVSKSKSSQGKSSSSNNRKSISRKAEIVNNINAVDEIHDV